MARWCATECVAGSSAAVQAHAAALQPGASYLFGAGREALTMPFEALGGCVHELLMGGVR